MNERPTRIFIVEDEALTAMELKDRLTRLDYTVCGVAARGETTIGQIADAKPDLVLMDISLAGELDGIETANRLRERNDVPLVLLTAYSDDAMLRRAADAGPFSYLVNPFEERELHATIQMALYKHRMQRALREANAGFEERVRERTRQLAASQERFAAFARAGGDWLWESKPGGRLVYFSASVTKSGFDVSQHLGRTWRETTSQDPENRARLGELEALMARRQSFRDFVYQIRSESGAIFWCSISGDPILGPANDFQGYRGVGRDVTEAVKAQAELTAQNNIFEAMLKAIPDAVRVVDAEKRTVALNDEFYALFDLDKQADFSSLHFVHRSLLEVARRGEYGPGDPETLARNRLAEVERLLAAEGSFHYEQRLKNGRWFEGRIEAIEGGGWAALYRDVTEAKLRERELVRQSALLETIFASMGEGISVLDEDLNLVAANARFFDLAGVDPAIGQPGAALRDILVSQAKAGEFGACDPEAEADRRGQEFRQPNPLARPLAQERTRPNGRTIELRRNPITGGGFVTIYVDITTRKQFEQELQDLNATLERRVEDRTAALAASEHFNRATLDALGAHVAVLEADGRIIATNTAWQRSAASNDIDPLNAGEGANYLDACDQATGEYSGEAHAIAAGIRAVIARQRDAFEIEYTRHTPAQKRWLLCRVSRFHDGDLVRLVVSHEDVTTVHQALEQAAAGERVFASLAQASPVGIVRLDAEGRREYVNRRWCEIAGLSAEEVLGAEWGEVLHPEDRARVLGEWAEATSSRTPFRSEYRFQRPDGTVSWLIGQAMEITDAAGGIAGYISTLTDITERKQTESALRAISSDLAFLQGPAFLEAAARTLGDLLDADTAFVTEWRAADPDRLRTMVMIEDGQISPNFDYAVAGTPCAGVMNDGGCIVARGVARQFPEDAFLVGKAIESYAAQPLIDSAGQRLGHIGVMSRKPLANPTQAETILKLFSVAVAAALARQRSEQRFAELVELAPDAIVMADNEGRITMANQAAERVFGWMREELLGQSVEMLLPARFSQDHVFLRRAYLDAGRSRLIAGNRPNLRARRKDGSEFPVELSLAPIEAPQGKSVVAIVRDVTEREAAEQEILAVRGHLLDAFESVGHGIMLTDAEDRILLFNHSYAEHYGDLADEIKVGARFEDIFRVAIDRGLIAIPAGQEKEDFIAERVARHRRADGEPMTRLHASGRVLSVTERRARNGGVIVIGIDVTEQLRTEQQLREAQRMEAIGRLTGGLAHDFNNYLGVIIGNLDLILEQKAVDPAATKLVDAALSGAMRSAELTQSLLAFSRRQPLAPRRTDVSQRLDAIVTLLKRTLGEDIVLTTSFAPDLWPVRIDGAQLDSCIVNLANNARDAMPNGGALAISTGNIQLDAQYTKSNPEVTPGDYVVIEVSDTGVGMPPETVEQAFEPFFTTKAPDHGTGLGLSMVYGFVKQSGGHIMIHSEVGRGTAVKIYLPRERQAAEAAVAADARAQPAPGRGTETILVVEDNEQMRQAAVAQLASLGYRVIEAKSGDAALAILDQHEQRLDLLFTDIVMPGKPDGYDLAILALERRPGIRIIVTSGFPGDAVRQDDKRVAALSLLGKPYRKAELARAIRTALDSEPPRPGGP